MNLSFLTNFTVPIIVGICLCVGYVLKNIVTKVENGAESNVE